jgi:uncharacterized protein YecA (UPF0149 family)
MSFSTETLRREFLPSTQLEELFFDAIVRLSTCAHYLGLHIEKDPEFANPETPRRLRLLLSTESKLRVAYEEFRRLKVARQLQNEDVALAAQSTLTVVSTHTTRNGLRVRRASRPVEPAASVSAKPTHVGRNSPCPCKSGRKYKQCCLNKQMAQAA